MQQQSPLEISALELVERSSKVKDVNMGTIPDTLVSISLVSYLLSQKGMDRFNSISYTLLSRLISNEVEASQSPNFQSCISRSYSYHFFLSR